MKCSIIGLGGIARKYYLPYLSAQSDMELQTVSRTAATAEEAARQFHAAASATQPGEVLRWKPDATLVLSPSATHYDWLRELLSAGLDVFVEKPATLDATQTAELADLADRRHCVFMVGFNRRYAPLHRQAREAVGETAVEQATFTKFRTRPFHDSVRNHLYDDTIHIIDTLRFFCGDGEVIHSELRVGETFTGATALIGLASGGIAQVVTNMHAGGWREEYLLAGGGMTAALQAFSTFSWEKDGRQMLWQERYDSGSDTTTGRGFSGEIEHFLECVSTRQQPLSDGWDSVKTQKLVEAIAGSV
jgi:virulence factor